VERFSESRTRMQRFLFCNRYPLSKPLFILRDAEGAKLEPLARPRHGSWTAHASHHVLVLYTRIRNMHRYFWRVYYALTISLSRAQARAPARTSAPSRVRRNVEYRRAIRWIRILRPTTRIIRWLALSWPLDEFTERIADVYRARRASSADARCVKPRDGHDGITRAILQYRGIALEFLPPSTLFNSSSLWVMLCCTECSSVRANVK